MIVLKRLNFFKETYMSHEKEKCVKKCESELSCKATAAVNGQVVDDLKKEDASLEELIDASSNDSDGE